MRLLPGVLGDAQSAVEDSFADGLLDCPHYTRPEVYEAEAVPAVLLSGHHQNIRRCNCSMCSRRGAIMAGVAFKGTVVKTSGK